MQKGDRIQLKIESCGMGGEGVARYDSMVVFVPATLPGDQVLAQVSEVKKNYVRAKVYKLLQASPDRVEPLCPIFYRCGGCEMQHVSYERQLETKRRWVKDAIAKECRVAVDVEPIYTDGRQFGYRNKIQVPLALIDGKVCAGYYKPQSHEPVPFEKIDSAQLGDCPLTDRHMQDIVDLFCAWAQKRGVGIYDERAHSGLLRHLVVRRVGDAYAITVVVNGTTLPYRDELVRTFCEHGLTFSLYLSVNDKRTNVIMGNKIRLLYGQARLPQEILGVKCEVSPLSFMQVNDNVRDEIYRTVGQIVSRYARCVAIDAYSGVGVTTNLLARFAERAIGIEIVPDAVADADRLAALNGNRDKITNICGDCRKALPDLMRTLEADYDVSHRMRLDHEAFEAIRNGEKRYELRLFDAKRAALKIGDVIRFTDLSDGRILDVRVQTLDRFANFGALFDVLGDKGICAGEIGSKETFENAMRAYYEDERVARYGVLAIGLEALQTTVLVLDPPRKGCDFGVIESIMTAPPQAIVYVSCNPATLARDLNYLLPAYEIQRVVPFDMFPNCAHVETLVSLVRK